MSKDIQRQDVVNRIDSDIQKSDKVGKTAGDGQKTGERDKTPPDKVDKERISKLRIIFGVFSFLASLATVAMAFLSWKTLENMHEERNIAYRPDILVLPNTFEGGIAKENEVFNKKYISFVYDPTRTDSFLMLEPSDKGYQIAIEKPYLTLKNIGQGTAKNVQVIFSEDWLKETAALLNDDYNDDYDYKIENNTIKYFLPGKDKEYQTYYPRETEFKKDIMYIVSGDYQVSVELPESWYEMLGLYFSRYLQFNGPHTSEGNGKCELSLPDIQITVQCSDMQGKQMDPTVINIPWSVEVDFTTENGKLELLSIRMRLYEEYL